MSKTQTDTHLEIDRSVCAGHGLCYSIAPHIVDSDEQGYPVVLQNPVPASMQADLERIIDACPERALRTTPSGTPQEGK